MSEKLFRQKNLDRIKSPESLNDYVRISNPGVWLLLIAIIALLIGACCWAVFGRLESTQAADIRVENGAAVCVLSADDVDTIAVGMRVKIGDSEGVISDVEATADKSLTCSVDLKDSLPDGIYAAEIVTEEIRPISFVLN